MTPEQRERKRQRQRELYRLISEEARQKKLASSRKWREENPDLNRSIARESMARARAEQPEKYSAYMREYYQRSPEHKERQSVRMAKYYQNNKAQIDEKHRRWIADNIEKERIRAKNKAAWRRQASGRFYPSDIQALYERQSGKCAICGHVFPETGTHRFEIDHIIPLKPRGATIPRGTNDPENLQLLCRPCNIKKGNRIPTC